MAGGGLDASNGEFVPSLGRKRPPFFCPTFFCLHCPVVGQFGGLIVVLTLRVRKLITQSVMPTMKLTHRPHRPPSPTALRTAKTNATSLLYKAPITSHFLENSCNPSPHNTLRRAKMILLYTNAPIFENHSV